MGPDFGGVNGEIDDAVGRGSYLLGAAVIRGFIRTATVVLPAGVAEVGAAAGVQGPAEQERAREDRQQAGRNIRVAAVVAADPAARARAQEHYAALPPPVQDRVQEEGFQLLGRMAGGAVFSAGFGMAAAALVGALLARNPRTVAHAVHARRFAQIWAGATAGGLTFAGNAALVQRAQRDLFAHVPGAEQAVNAARDDILESAAQRHQ